VKDPTGVAEVESVFVDDVTHSGIFCSHLY